MLHVTGLRICCRLLCNFSLKLSVAEVPFTHKTTPDCIYNGISQRLLFFQVAMGFLAVALAGLNPPTHPPVLQWCERKSLGTRWALTSCLLFQNPLSGRLVQKLYVSTSVPHHRLRNGNFLAYKRLWKYLNYFINVKLLDFHTRCWTLCIWRYVD